MKKKIIIFAIALLIILPNMSFAAVLCDNCQVGTQKCVCSIDNCNSGFVEIYTSDGCTGDPISSYTFSGGIFKWSPRVERTYYLKAYCDDRIKTSGCDPNVARAVGTTTTSSTSTTSTTRTTTPQPPKEDNTLIYLALILVVFIVIFVYLFLIRKKKPKVGYEELYRKYGR